MVKRQVGDVVVEQADMKQQLYIIMLKFLMLISVFSISGNLLLHMPFDMNIKWIFSFCVALICYLYNKYRGFSFRAKFLFFLFLIIVYMPISFVNAGGSKSDIIAYIFIVLITVTYIFDGRYRNILIATIIASFIGMFLFDYLCPEKIPVYDEYSRFIDRLTQVPILLLTSFFIIRRFANAYDEVNQKLIRYANYDELTGLINRRNFNDLLQKQLDAGNNDSHLILMDVDNFKMINDKKGHMAGDDVLKYVARLLSRYFNDGQSVISRWGGDEFVVLYFGEWKELDNILEKAIKEFKHYIEPIEPLVDISVGISSLAGFKTVNDVFTMSDRTMYKQKSLKKNVNI